MAVSGAVLLLEGGLTVVFLTLLLLGRNRGGEREDSLWILVWATRLFASLNGARRLSGANAELFTYVALQACSGLSLMLIMSRYELKLFKDKLVRRLFVQLSGAEEVSPSRSLSGADAEPR